MKKLNQLAILSRHPTRSMVVFLSAAMILLSFLFGTGSGDGQYEIHYFEREPLMEVFTATWCVPCKFSDSALDEIAEEFKGKVSIVKYHVFDDGLDTVQTNERASNYNVIGVPHAFVDGTLSKLGANSKEKAYESYKSLIEERLRTESPLRIFMTGSEENRSVELKVYFEMLRPINETGLYARFVLYENKVNYSGKEYNFVVRSIAEGIFNSSRELEMITKSLEVNQSWKLSEAGFVVFVQKSVSGEVLQSSSRSFSDFSQPIIGISSLRNGTKVSQTAVLQGRAFDSKNVTSVEIRIDNGDWIEAEGATSWRFTLDTRSLPNGEHNISARAFNGQYYSDVESVTILVSNPSITAPLTQGSIIFIGSALTVFAVMWRIKREKISKL